MIKQEIYPKTVRVPVKGFQIQITEKLDGSNLVIFKTQQGTLGFALRNNIFFASELEEAKPIMYKGLYGWIEDHINELEIELYEGSAICGEWLGMGQLKYTVDEFDKRFYMFAKARITSIAEGFKLDSIMYDHSLFIYPFNSRTIPSFIGVVPVVADIKYLPNKEDLDKIYDGYKKKVERDVEGFVVNFNNSIQKYVRMKNGKMKEHFDWESK